MSEKLKKPCTCWQDKNAAMREKFSLQISRQCELLAMSELDMVHMFCLPLERIDGAKLNKTQPRTITISYCPFCGKKLKNT